MLQDLISGSTFQKGILVTLGGMAGVFFVLILFYLMIKIITKLFPFKDLK
jgi:Na+-transporting methylmalonyl-CoA/oxaloacetate decarboxylase gamma subunit